MVDGGFPEFLLDAANAWEPVPGRPGEYRSRRPYPAVAGAGRRGVAVLGNFADTLVPLHGYRFVSDFRTDNPYWNLPDKLSADHGVWCGPGLWFDADTGRIHARLAHTRLRFLGAGNYRGETDPGKLPLVVAGPDAVVRLEGVKHLRLHDLVLRGSAGATLALRGGSDVELDGVTIHGGSPALQVSTTSRLRLHRCRVRGLTAPWSSRASHKYRGNSAYLVVVSAEPPGCRDFTFAHSEFTDNHDGLIVGALQGLTFHHNLVEQFDDDAIYLTMQRPKPPERLHFYQNVFARCLTAFAFAQFEGGRRNTVGSCAFISRNVFDLRRGTPAAPPASDREDLGLPESWNQRGRLAGDHGSPVWEPMTFYHNTVLTAEAPWRDQYAAGLASHTAGTRRRVFNNLFVQDRGVPGSALPVEPDDFAADANLHWSRSGGPRQQADWLAALHRSRGYQLARKRASPGWAGRDRVADPRFLDLPADPNRPCDLRLRPDSPAIDAGVALPAEWPDPLRRLDPGLPDLGALPAGAGRLVVGPASAPP